MSASLRGASRLVTGLAVFGLAGCSAAPEAGDLSGWNVLLVTFDTLRADRVGFAGYEGASTPVLDDLAKRGVVFERAIAPGPVTLPSHASVLTGLYPPAHGALDNGFYRLPPDVPTLAGRLREHGWETAAIVGSHVLHSRYGLGSGFDRYDDDIQSPRGTGQAYRERSAGVVSALANEWLEARDPERPFFLWLHYWDPHAPYFPPEGFRGLPTPYDGEIAYADHALGRVISRLEESGTLGRTLVVFTSDHGEGFGEAGELTHGILLRNSTLRVPLVFSAAEALPSGRRVRGTVSTADIVPTVLDLLGLPRLPRTDGESLVTAMAAGRSEGRLAYSETRLPLDQFGWSMLAGVRGDRWAWVRAPRPELYDLAEDPGETNSVHAIHVDVAEELNRATGAVLDDEREVLRDELGAEEVAALRALGYAFSREAPERTGADPKDRIDVLFELNLVGNYLERREYDRVVTGSRAILERDPTNRDAELFLAQALHATGRLDEAIDAAQRAFARGGEVDLHGTLLAMYLAEAGRFDESEALLRAFIDSDPDYAEHRFNLGNLMNEAGRQDEAIAAYEEALALNPEGVHILGNLAFTLARRGDRRALQLIDRATELAANEAPEVLRVEILGLLGEREAALEAVRELQRRPLSEKARERLAEAVRGLPDS